MMFPSIVITELTADYYLKKARLAIRTKTNIITLKIMF